MRSKNADFLQKVRKHLNIFPSVDENKMLIVLLSMAANVISCHTSMVGVDKECKEKVIGDLIRQNVPVMYDAPMMMRCSGFAAQSMSGCALQARNYLSSAPMIKRRRAFADPAMSMGCALQARNYSTSAPIICRSFTASAMPSGCAPKARKYSAPSPSRRLIKFVDKVKVSAERNVSSCIDGVAECGGDIIMAF